MHWNCSVHTSRFLLGRESMWCCLPPSTKTMSEQSSKGRKRCDRCSKSTSRVIMQHYGTMPFILSRTTMRGRDSSRLSVSKRVGKTLALMLKKMSSRHWPEKGADCQWMWWAGQAAVHCEETGRFRVSKRSSRGLPLLCIPWKSIDAGNYGYMWMW